MTSLLPESARAKVITKRVLYGTGHANSQKRHLLDKGIKSLGHVRAGKETFRKEVEDAGFEFVEEV